MRKGGRERGKGGRGRNREGWREERGREERGSVSWCMCMGWVCVKVHNKIKTHTHTWMYKMSTPR